MALVVLAGAILGADAVEKFEIQDFVDCTGPWHWDWQHFRSLFRDASREASTVEHPHAFPGFQQELFKEAYRLYQKWYHYMARGLEDYPTGAAAFYHACHYNEYSEYCNPRR